MMVMPELDLAVRACTRMGSTASRRWLAFFLFPQTFGSFLLCILAELVGTQ